MDLVPEGPSARSETMGGLAKGLAIIELFGAGKPLTLSDAARGSGTTPAAARRCLLTLAELGYVRQIGRHFEPLARLRHLGGGGPTLAEIAEPLIARTRDALDETVSVAVLEGRDARFVARAEAGRLIQTGVREGASLPAWSTAAGRVLLGGLSDAEVRRYLAQARIVPRTPRSIVDPKVLEAEIRTARERGVAYNDEELELGMRAMAVAVRAEGVIVAAITFSALTLRVSLQEMDTRYRPVLEATAADLAHAWIEATC